MPRGPRVLPPHPGPKLGPFQETGVINDWHTLGVTELLDHVVPHAVADLVDVPVRPAQQPRSTAAYNRGNSGTGHRWSGAYQVYYNWVGDSMVISNPPGTRDWALGCRATKRT